MGAGQEKARSAPACFPALSLGSHTARVRGAAATASRPNRIYNILKVAVTKRIREYGTLRAIGSEQRQLYLLVTVQLLILCGIGLPLGLLLGSISAKGILTAVLGMLNPDLFLAENTRELNAMIADSRTGGPLPMVLSVFVTLLFEIGRAHV